MISPSLDVFGHSPEGAFDAGIGQRVIVVAGLVEQLLRQPSIFTVLRKRDINGTHESGSAKALQVPGKAFVGRTVPPLGNLDKPGPANFRVPRLAKTQCGIDFTEFVC